MAKSTTTPEPPFVNLIGDAIAEWQREPPATSPERIAFETGKSASTVFRWWAQSGPRFEPRMSDILVMERLKPGLIARLLKLVKKAKRNG